MLYNVIINNLTGFDLINNISKYTDGCVTCFFLRPDTLWCGLLYTPYSDGNDVLSIGSAKLQLGYNAVKDNALKIRSATDDVVGVKYSNRLSNGNKLSETSDVFENCIRMHGKVLGRINDSAVLKQLANEKAYRINYSGYEGTITSFLQPYVTPGTLIYLSDDRYPERNGNLVDSTEVYFGVRGARRMLEIGPQSGFAK